MPKLHVHPIALGPDRFGDPELFSAFYPLGCLVAFAKQHKGGVLQEAFTFGAITPRQERDIPDILRALPGEPGIFLLSSYVWNHATNMAFARAAKERLPGSVVVVGGPHIPREPGPCQGFFTQNPHVDVAVRHEGEATLADVLETIATAGVEATALTSVDLGDVLGISFRRGQDLIRTPDRPRSRDLSLYPSPYTSGEFDHWLRDVKYMPLETNRGCPYGCTFCDWGAATLSKISQLSMDRVRSEVDFAAARRVHTIGFCDANFGILPRDLEIVQYIIDVNRRHGFPKEVGYTNAKSAKPRLTEIVKALRDAGLTAAGQISMQTIDEGVLRNVERANIKTSEYKKMIAFFHREGIPAVSDMMLGLPGQTLETCKKDLQFFFDHKVLAVIFATSVMPNAPMADEAYRARFGIELDADGMVEATYSFSRQDYARMFDLCLTYKLFVKLGLLKYVLYYVQVEHGVSVVQVLERWLERVSDAPALYPLSARVRRDLLGRDYRGGRKDWLVLAWGDEQAAFLFDDFAAFQSEFGRFLSEEFSVLLDGPAAEAVLRANREVMPRKDRPSPQEIVLPHDVAGYFSDLRRVPSLGELPEGHLSLRERPPGVVRLEPRGPTTSYQFADVGLTFGALEVASNLGI